MAATFIRVVVAAAALLAVVVPARAQAPAGPPGTVTLPLSEYDRLAERAARPPAPPAIPPVPAFVSRADLQLRAAPGDLRGSITLTGEVLAAGWARVPLLAGGTLVDAQQGGRTAQLTSEGRTTSAILAGPAPFVLAVTWSAEVTTEPGRAMAWLPAVQAGSVHATIEMPGENGDVRLDPGLVSARSSAGGKTIVEATLVPGTPSRLSWSSRDHVVPAAHEVRLASDVKTLITVGETDARLAALFDVTVIQGEPDRLDLRLPDGFEVVSMSGAAVETSGQQNGRLPITLREPGRRRQQFLLTLERTVAGGLQHAEVVLPAVAGAQRETGEVAWEGLGTVELTAPEKGALRRLDVTEVSASLATLARAPLLSAFRYQRHGDEPVAVEFDVRRFADAPVIAAAADRAVVTTLVTGEGRALTEFALVVRNRGQRFLKVALPPGSTLLTAEVAGEAVKPVEGADGTRVPLLRAGLRPAGAYTVSFVYLASGSALGKKGEGHLPLARVDVPIGVLEWELFLPDKYKVRKFTGDLMPRDLIPALREDRGASGLGPASGGLTGQAAAPKETVTAEAGLVASQPESVTYRPDELQRSERPQAQAQSGANAPSQNVQNLQRRVAGVLPVRVDVPRAGQSYVFVRPLVLDEETTLRFQYKTK